MLPELKKLKIDAFDELTELKIADSAYLDNIELENITHRGPSEQETLTLGLAKTKIKVLKFSNCILQSVKLESQMSNIEEQILFYQSIVDVALINMCLTTGAAQSKNLVLQNSQVRGLENQVSRVIFNKAKEEGNIVVIDGEESTA